MHSGVNGGSAIARLFGGGTRGDFVGVDGAGCLYATQSSELLRVTNLDGSCARAASAPPSAVATGLGAGLVPTNVRAMSVTVAAPRRPTACAAGRRLIARYRARRGVHVVSARIYIGRHLARRVSGRALRHGVTLRKLPTGRFTLVIRARTTRHRTIVVRRHYGTCAGRRA